MLIGVDYGTKRVGVAISDPQERVAFPLEVVPQKKALDRIAELVDTKGARAVVMGESKNFSGEDNPLMEKIREFAKQLQLRAKTNILFEPEFMTSAQAKQIQSENEKLDASAAALILQSYLDKASLR